MRAARSILLNMDSFLSTEESHVDLLHEIGNRLATADGFHDVLTRVVDFASALVKCDSCLIYVLEGEELVLRASKNPHPDVVDRLKLRVGQGITGWVAEHQEPVAVAEKAALEPRFQFFHELPEDSYEAFLSVPLMCRGRVVGVINLQHRQAHNYRRREIRLISTVGFRGCRDRDGAAGCQLQSVGAIADAQSGGACQGNTAARTGISEEHAYLALQRQSRQKRKPMKEIAEAIVLSDEVKGNSRTPGPS